MKIFKFGVASIKDADSVRNVANVLSHYPGEEILIVMSAINKTTNARELQEDSFINQKDDTKKLIKQVKEQHFVIINELFPAGEHRVHNDVEILFSPRELVCETKWAAGLNQAYRQIVSFGELVSRKIIFSILYNKTSDWGTSFSLAI